jgi:beta-mannosidase
VEKQYQPYNAGTSLLHSEFGVEGITNLKALNATIAPEHQWPATRDNPIWDHRGSWWNQSPMREQVFGEIGDIVTLQRATQMMQAEGLRYAIEANRRRWPQNSGSLPWQFNEPYPMATCTSAIDYHEQARPVYYAVAKAYEPIYHITARYPTLTWAGRDQFEAEVWIHDRFPVGSNQNTLTIKLIGVSGEIHKEWSLIPRVETECIKVAEITHPLDDVEDVFFLDLKLTNEYRRWWNRYVFSHGANLAPLLNVPPTKFSIEMIKRSESDWWLYRFF